jgi:hypothetical protein
MPTQESDNRPLRAKNDIPASRKPHESNDSATKGSMSSLLLRITPDALKVQHFLQPSCTLVPIIYHSQNRIELLGVVDGMIFEHVEGF